VQLREIRPQPGPQEAFLATPADIAVYGGSAGGGKTWASLLEPVRHIRNPKFAAVIFRRTTPQITNEGGLWDESATLYPLLGARPKEYRLEWVFPHPTRDGEPGMTIRFSHMEREADKFNWQGSQVPLFIFDELTHFTEGQFWYVAMSRGRSSSGVTSYVRGTCNPDPTSWVKKFLAPWVDRKWDGPGGKAKSGEIRWFVRTSGVIRWLSPGEEEGEPDAKSVTFIRASVFDNKIMLRQNPQYLANLKALPPYEQATLLYGDWDVLPEGGKIVHRDDFKIVHGLPSGREARYDSFGRLVHPAVNQRWVRWWDFAATEKKLRGPDPDFTVGLKMLRVGSEYIITDLIHVQISASHVEDLVVSTAQEDGLGVAVRWGIEPGAMARMTSHGLTTRLNGFDAYGVPDKGDKVVRFKPFASQVRAGNVALLYNPVWNDDLLNEVHHLPDWPHDDIVDGCSGAYSELTWTGEEVVSGPDPFAM
jgi:predicted phage terminase large subunit-like protein